MSNSFYSLSFLNGAVGLVFCCSGYLAQASEQMPEEQKLGYWDALASQLGVSNLAVQIKSDLYSDPLPLKYFGKSNWTDYMQARPGMNLVRIDQSASIELGLKDASQSLSLLARSSGRLVLSEGTARRLSTVVQGEKGSQDWQVSPQLALKGFTGYGLDWQQTHDLGSHWQWQWGAQGLVLRSLYARDMQGDLSYQAVTQTYIFNARSIESSSNLQYPYQTPYDSTGQGLMFQTHLAWQSGHLEIEAGVRDLGWLRWQELPRQELILNSNVKERDNNGYLLYRPLLKGQNSQPTVVWSAPWTGDLKARWSFTQHHQLSLPWQYIPQFGWLPAYRWSDSSGRVPWAVEWRSHERNLVFQAQWKNWSANWGLANSESQSRSQVWRLTYAKRF